tara:strand:- start:243 stop:497 length:255 start_codon:yes stop_codon:yes gene_type:complete
MPPKQNKPKQKKQKKVKPVCRQVDTSCAKKTRAYSKAPDLNVEKDINKNKEVKESDVFDVPSAKQNKAKSPKKKLGVRGNKSNY